MRSRLRGSLGVPTGDCQPQGTASSRGRPKADAPSLGETASSAGPPSEVRHGLCQYVCPRSDAIFSPLSVSLCRLCQSLCVSLSLSLPPCACAFARAPARVCLSVAPSRCLPVCLGTFISFCLCLSRQPAARPFLWPRPLTGAMALAEELAPAGCLPSRGCVRVSGRLSVCLPVARGGFGHPAGAGQDGRSGPRLGCA